MRQPRRLAAFAAVSLLMLLAAACGGNDATETEEATATEAATSEAAATEEATTEAAATEEATTEAAATEEAMTEAAATEEATTEAAATEAGGDASGQVTLEDRCAEYSDVTAPEDFNVGLVTDIGRVDDGTFNQFAYEGLVAAEECFGIPINFIETQSEADYEANINTILGDEPEIVVTVGFLITDATVAAATANPEVVFIGVDQFVPEYPPNMVGILFREDQGGYLAGAMAALLSESGVVGVVGGREDVPPVVRFVNGFISGATAINPDINALSVYNPSFTDPAAGRSAAEQFLGEGADVIFGAGGQTGSGGITAAAEAGAWAIGVDQDEYFTTFGGGTAPGSDRLATSAMKRVDLGVFTNIANALAGTLESGIFTLDAANGGITYAPFHDAAIPDDVATQIEEIRAGLADGSIDTGIDPNTGLPA